MVNKTKLINESNEISDNFKKEHCEEIFKIIEDNLTEEKFEKVAKESDLKGANNFYMIFCDNEPNDNNCTCKISVSNKGYYCGYRGHSFNTKERLQGHLFNGSNSKYSNCMLVPYENEKYII